MRRLAQHELFRRHSARLLRRRDVALLRLRSPNLKHDAAIVEERKRVAVDRGDGDHANMIKLRRHRLPQRVRARERGLGKKRVLDVESGHVARLMHLRPVHANLDVVRLSNEVHRVVHERVFLERRPLLRARYHLDVEVALLRALVVRYRHAFVNVHRVAETLEIEAGAADQDILGRLPERIVIARDLHVLAVEVPLVELLHDELAIRELALVPQPRVAVREVFHLDHDSRGGLSTGRQIHGTCDALHGDDAHVLCGGGEEDNLKAAVLVELLANGVDFGDHRKQRNDLVLDELVLLRFGCVGAKAARLRKFLLRKVVVDHGRHVPGFGQSLALGRVHEVKQMVRTKHKPIEMLERLLRREGNAVDEHARPDAAGRDRDDAALVANHRVLLLDAEPVERHVGYRVAVLLADNGSGFVHEKDDTAREHGVLVEVDDVRLVRPSRGLDVVVHTAAVLFPRLLQLVVPRHLDLQEVPLVRSELLLPHVLCVDT
eukprot:Opistho-1_new@58588